MNSFEDVLMHYQLKWLQLRWREKTHQSNPPFLWEEKYAQTGICHTLAHQSAIAKSQFFRYRI